MKTHHLIKHLAAFTFAIIGASAQAQKLPNVQKDGVRAPAKIRVDGKTTEWDNKFEAYNKATDVFYTISNDDNYLYVTVQATQAVIIRKIIGGGVLLTINTSGKKSDKGSIGINYPVFEPKQRPSVNLRGKVESSDDAYSPKQLDSVMQSNNASLAKTAKLISVTGIPGVDSLISVYNDDGIKAAGLFDSKGAYTCELAIDLKKLGLTVNNPVKFAYHITLSGAPAKIMNLKTTSGGGEQSVATPVQVGDMGGGPTLKIVAFGQFSSPTDFWAEYTLVK